MKKFPETWIGLYFSKSHIGQNDPKTNPVTFPCAVNLKGCTKRDGKWSAEATLSCISYRRAALTLGTNFARRSQSSERTFVIDDDEFGWMNNTWIWPQFIWNISTHNLSSRPYLWGLLVGAQRNLWLSIWVLFRNEFASQHTHTWDRKIFKQMECEMCKYQYAYLYVTLIIRRFLHPSAYDCDEWNGSLLFPKHVYNRSHFAKLDRFSGTIFNNCIDNVLSIPF